MAILSGEDNVFPMHLWVQLLIQAEMMLNMLRPTKIALRISAYTYMYG